MADFKAAKARVNYSDFYRSELTEAPTFKKDGWNDGGLCPFHNDTHKGSFRVNTRTGYYECFACGAKGDAIDFLSNRYGMTKIEALKRLDPTALSERTRGADDHQRRAPAILPKQTGPKPWEWEKVGFLDATYDYCDADGNLVIQVLKSKKDPKTGKKSFFQRRPDPEKPGRWINNLDGLKPPVPLFRHADLLAAINIPGKIVCLTEGEKDALTLFELGITATTAAHGKWRPEHIELLTAATCQLLIFVDNDDAGRKKAAHLFHSLPMATLVEFVGMPEKSDVTDFVDELRTNGSTDNQIKLRLKDLYDDAKSKPTPAWADPVKLDEKESVFSDKPHGAQPEPAKPPVDSAISLHENKLPFRFLGRSNQMYYFLPKNAPYIHKYNRSAFGQKQTLMELADQQWWEFTSCFFSKNGVDMTAAANWLIQESQRVGEFRPERIRGRGAWSDDKRIVLHIGDQLFCDESSHPLFGFKSRFIYAEQTPIDIELQPAANTDLGERVIALCQSISWDQQIYGTLLAGWIAIAPICGILGWRPHIWVTGEVGAGKSFVIENIVGRLLGCFKSNSGYGERSGIVLMVQSNTSEAGIRQSLGCDALPVVFDEAETDTEKGKTQITSVIELARQASSDASAGIRKGSASGEVTMFKIRSAFCMGSVAVGIQRRADETRITTLWLRKLPTDSDEQKQERAANFARLEAAVNDICTPENASRLTIRACKLAQMTVKNARLLAEVYAAKHGDRRTGDQIGALLAGVASLRYDAPLTTDQAENLIEDLPLHELVPSDDTKDERDCLNYLMAQKIFIDGRSGPRVERTIGELLEKIHTLYSSTLNGVPCEGCTDEQEALMRHGIRYEHDEGLIISNTHPNLKKLFHGTPFAIKPQSFLKRIKRASIPRKPYRFTGISLPTKVVVIPFAEIFPDTAQVVTQETDEDVPF